MKLFIKHSTIVFMFFGIISINIISCDYIEEPIPLHNTTPYIIDIPERFPTILNIPADNPMTVEGVSLGRHLFYDGRLSGNTHPDSLMTCSSCHLQKNSFECGIDHPEYIGGFTHGISGIPTHHVMLPLFNLVWNKEGYLWNGYIHENNPNPERRKLEALVWMGIIAPHEMNGDTNRTKALIESIAMYPPMFKLAFGDEKVTIERISKAVAQFIRSLIAANSKAHRVFRGEESFTNSESRGYNLFVTEEGADCFHCHGTQGTPLWTTNLYYNNAKDSAFNDPRDRFAITGDPSDIGAYRAPSLINCELTGPYMHDGRFSTLEEVIDFYNHALVWSPYIHPLMHKIDDNGAQLAPFQKQDLLNFLKALTDSSFINNPDHSNPRPGDPFFIN